jgi:hypothetical protein
MLKSGLGVAGLIIIVFSTVTTTFLDAYSAGVSGKTIAKKINEKSLAVSVTIIGYGNIDADFANLYPHDMSDEITAEYGGRWVVFSADDSGVVAGVISLGDDSRAAFTMHQGLVMPITEVMIHDLYIAEIMKEHRAVLEKTFGKNLIDLRNKFAIHPDHKKHYIE